jgi:hypothetical protein
MTRFGYGIIACACVALVNCSTPPPPVLAPSVTTVAPATVDVGGGTSITLTGTNFEGGTPNAQVTLGSKQCQEVNVVSDSQIKCVTPPFDAEATVDVKVKNGGASAGAAEGVCAGCLTIKDILGPKVTEGFPQQNAVVSILVSAKAKFNEPVDALTITSTSFHISGTNVIGNTSCNFECNKPCAGATNVTAICFKPTQPLQYSGSYTVVATDAITDLKGNKLQGVDAQGQLKWNFSTRCQGCGNPWLGDIAAASGFTSSGKYKLYSVTGQPTPVGEATSANYKLQSGFIYSSQQ